LVAADHITLDARRGRRHIQGMAETSPTGFSDVSQALIGGHPLITGKQHDFTPHRPERPEKSEGGVRFRLASEFSPQGDQPEAIRELVEGTQNGEQDQEIGRASCRERV